MKISLYSTAWNIHKYNFFHADALDNWVRYADEICIAVNNCEHSYVLLDQYAKAKGYPVKLIRTNFPESDSFMYGKIENSALQACTGDILIQQNLDERIRANKDLLPQYRDFMLKNGVKALFLPTIDLYNSENEFVNISKKWYIHLPGLNRGAVKFGIKPDGKPDYNKTSSDELLDNDGNLVPTISMIESLDVESLRDYVERGFFLSFHLGYMQLNDRAEKAKWWKEFWERATGGDKNSHITDVAELMKRETRLHGLPLWK